MMGLPYVCTRTLIGCEGALVWTTTTVLPSSSASHPSFDGHGFALGGDCWPLRCLANTGYVRP